MNCTSIVGENESVQLRGAAIRHLDPTSALLVDSIWVVGPRVETWCRVEIWRGGSGAPFPDPAHQTGRAVFPHPAFGQGLAFAHGRLSCLRFGIQRSLQLPNL